MNIHKPLEDQQNLIFSKLESCLKSQVNPTLDKYLDIYFQIGDKLKKSLQENFILDNSHLHDIYIKLDKLHKALKLVKSFLDVCENRKSFYLSSKSTVKKTHEIQFAKKLSTILIKTPNKGFKTIKVVKDLYKENATNRKEVKHQSDSVYELIEKIRNIMCGEEPMMDNEDRFRVNRSRSKTF